MTCALAGPNRFLAEEVFVDHRALHHFMPAGTLVQTLSATSPDQCCKHDGWHAFNHHFYAILSGLDDSLISSLDFLTKHEFIAVTARVAAIHNVAVLSLRIYIVPFDLSGVEGRLQRREAKVLHPGSRHMQTLMLRIDKDRDAWDGRPTLKATQRNPLFGSDLHDTRTIAELYNTLPSPQVDDAAWEYTDADTTRLSDMLDTGDIIGLKSKLYRYQRRAIVSMVQKEAPARFVPDALYVSLHGIDGTTFYFQPQTMEILRDRPMVPATRGGILCEELGTGKTVMVLGLVLATLDQLPTPEESIFDPRPVLTPLSLRTFPEEQETRDKLMNTMRKKRFPADANRLPSLFELCLHQCTLNADLLDLRDPEREERLSRLRVSDALRKNTPFYLHYNDKPNNSLRPRKDFSKAPRTVYLSSATLVIVPDTLHNQWASEINKHCDSTLRCYTSADGELPAARELLSYDIILLTHAKLSREASKTKLRVLHKSPVCRCPINPDSRVRVPECTCKKPRGVSPLLQVRWKRMVIDEGHNTSSKTTNFSRIIHKMSVECRWIVTGTPTTNLMGLQFGHTEIETPLDSSDEEPERESPQEFFEDLVYPPSQDDESSTEDLQQGFPFGSDQQSDGDSETSVDYRWSNVDRGDLTKLGTMMTHSLKVPEFVSNPTKFLSRVTTPLMHHDGPRPGSVRVLQQVMQSHMVRHLIEDIEAEITLPPLVQETVLLDLEPTAAKTYNLLQALVAVNAVDSERTGADWFFNPKNRKHLQQVIVNIFQSLFYHMDDNLMDVDETVKALPKILAKAEQRLSEGRLVDKDLELLRAAAIHIESAAMDPVWRAMQEHPYVFSAVYNFPYDAYTPWSLMPSRIGLQHDAQNRPFVWLNPDRLVQIRRLVLQRPLRSIEDMVEVGSLVSQQDKERRVLFKEKAGDRKDKKGPNPAARAESASKLLEIQNNIKQLSNADDSGNEQHVSSLVKQSPFARTRIGNSGSSKLDYILNEIMLYSAKEKFLIFSRSPMTLMYVAEALTLLNIPRKMTMLKAVRELRHEVMTYETSDVFRVFLMELKHGARGLNLVGATRIIFCEPVWQADVEAQAIKRAHRIGQTKPVTVKVLAIRDTSEEFMVARRDTLKRGMGAAGGQLPKLEEDNVMREFLSNPRFLTPGPSAVTLDYPLFPQIPQDPDEGGDSMAVDVNVASSSKGKQVDRRELRFESKPPSRDKVNSGIALTSTPVLRNPSTRPRHVAFAEPDLPEAEAPPRKIRRVRLILPDPPS